MSHLATAPSFNTFPFNFVPLDRCLLSFFEKHSAVRCVRPLYPGEVGDDRKRPRHHIVSCFCCQTEGGDLISAHKPTVCPNLHHDTSFDVCVCLCSPLLTCNMIDQRLKVISTWWHSEPDPPCTGSGHCLNKCSVSLVHVEASELRFTASGVCLEKLQGEKPRV